MKIAASSWLHARQVVVILSISLGVAACGGRESTASRSAAAYAEAKSKGVEITGGHDHGGHEAPDASASPAEGMAGMDHSQNAMGSTAETDHSQHGTGSAAGMNHTQHATGSTAGTDHSQHATASAAGTDHSQHATGSTAGTDHSQHATASAAGTDHSQHATASTAEQDHSQHGTDSASADDHSGHGTGAAIPPGGLWGPVPGSLSPATSASSEDEAGTLAPDALDAAAPVSVREAAKSAGASHEGHDMENEENER